MATKASEALLPHASPKAITIDKTTLSVSDDGEHPEVTECDCEELGFGAGDAVLSVFIVAPLVVGVWRGTWGIMDNHSDLFPYAQSFLLGILVHVCFALLRSHLLARSKGAWSKNSGSAGRWLFERFLSRVYTYVFILANITHWRGGWGLLDAIIVAIVPYDADPHRPVLYAAFTIAFYATTMCLRSSRNFLASPYFLVTDGKEATYIFHTRFKKSMNEHCGLTKNRPIRRPF